MTTPDTSHALAVGEMIEEFRITRILGSGGFGIVYECQNTHLPETAAIKEFLPPELAFRDPDGQVTPLSEQSKETFNWARDRFLQEAKTLWELARPERHPNIVRVTRYCEANGTAYMFMDFERGRSLSEILEQQERLPPDQLETLFYSLLSGLERVHTATILHRDIKPANILIRDDGTPVLIDFGAARRVVPGQERSIVSAYTPVYAALEQYSEAGDQGPWTDIYSFGAVLYQAVTGRKPQSAIDRLADESQRPVTEECKDNYPQPILAAIDSAMAIRPGDRPQSVTAWRQLAATASDPSGADEATVVMSAPRGPHDPTRVVSSPPRAPSPSPATSPQTPPQTASEPATKKPGQRNARVLLTAGLAGIVLMISGLGFYFFRDTVLPPLEPPSEPEAPQSEDTDPSPADEALVVRPAPPPEPPPSEPPPVPGTRFSDPMSNGGSGPIMVWLPAGTFQMGSPPEEAGRNLDERSHPVRIAEPFAISETELTLGRYRQFVETTDYRSDAGSEFPCLRPDKDWQQLVEDWSLTWQQPGYEVTERHPVACVSWRDAQAYADWLSAQTGRRYRLPTEQEWEYAARGGTTFSRFWGDDPQAGCKYANIAGCKSTPTYAGTTGTFPPNPFGLREILGNLAEWTCSEYDEGYNGGEAACADRRSQTPRVLRGGSWLDTSVLVRSAARDGARQNFRFNTVGLRLVRTLDPEPADDSGPGQF